MTYTYTRTSHVQEAWSSKTRRYESYENDKNERLSQTPVSSKQYKSVRSVETFELKQQGRKENSLAVQQQKTPSKTVTTPSTSVPKRQTPPKSHPCSYLSPDQHQIHSASMGIFDPLHLIMNLTINKFGSPLSWYKEAAS